MRVGVDRFQSTGADVGINFGCDDARVAEQSLNHSQISTVLQHVGCRTEPEGMRVDSLLDAGQGERDRRSINEKINEKIL